MKIKLSGVILTLSLAGCVTMPTPEEVSKADYGSYPSNYENVVKQHFDFILKDPDSVKYRSITTPQKYWLGDRIDGVKYGYLVCATFNGKNSYGAYTGYSTDALLIKNGAVVLYVPDGNWWGRELCN